MNDYDNKCSLSEFAFEMELEQSFITCSEGSFELKEIVHHCLRILSFTNFIVHFQYKKAVGPVADVVDHQVVSDRMKISVHTWQTLGTAYHLKSDLTL
jgi:hypothetical protein